VINVGTLRCSDCRRPLRSRGGVAWCPDCAPEPNAPVQAVAKDGLAPQLGSPGIPTSNHPNGERAGEPKEPA
jgi:hypothetical protein